MLHVPEHGLPPSPWTPEQAAVVAVVSLVALAQFWTLPLPVLLLLPMLSGGGTVGHAVAGLAAGVFAVLYAAAAGRVARREPGGVARAQQLSGIALALGALVYLLPFAFSMGRFNVYDYALVLGPFIVSHVALMHGLAVAQSYSRMRRETRTSSPDETPPGRGGTTHFSLRLSIPMRPVTAREMHLAAATGVRAALCVIDLGGLLCLCMAVAPASPAGLMVAGMGGVFLVLELLAARHMARHPWAWRLATVLSAVALGLCGCACLATVAALLMHWPQASLIALEAVAVLFGLAMSHFAGLVAPRLLAQAARRDVL
jgi:hypothetical protein